MLVTEVRTGDAPKPQFSIKSIEKSKKSLNQPLNRKKQKPYFLVCILGPPQQPIIPGPQGMDVGCDKVELRFLDW